MSHLKLSMVLGLIAGVGLACGGTDMLEGTSSSSSSSGSAGAASATPGAAGAAGSSAGQMSCDSPIDTPAPTGCVTAELACDESVEGHTRFGGSSRFDDAFYLAQYCTPQRNSYGEASEAMYWLSLPPNTQADITLTSDCADLDIASAQWNKRSICPDKSHSARPCEMDAKKGGGSIRITSVERAETHLVIVDGKKGDEGNFRISVSCSNYR